MKILNLRKENVLTTAKEKNHITCKDYKDNN